MFPSLLINCQAVRAGKRLYLRVPFPHSTGHNSNEMTRNLSPGGSRDNLGISGKNEDAKDIYRRERESDITLRCRTKWITDLRNPDEWVIRLSDRQLRGSQTSAAQPIFLSTSPLNRFRTSGSPRASVSVRECWSGAAGHPQSDSLRLYSFTGETRSIQLLAKNSHLTEPLRYLVRLIECRGFDTDGCFIVLYEE